MPLTFDEKHRAPALRPPGPASADARLQRQTIRRILGSGAASALPSLAMGGVPAVGGLVQGAMDQDAKALWEKITRIFVQTERPEAEKEGVKNRARLALGQLLSTAEGSALVRELARLFGPKSLEIHFVDKLEKSFETGAAGYFHPRDKGQKSYRIFLRNESGGADSLFRQYPQASGEKDPKILSSSTGPASRMAATLYHELLHVWFLNTQTGVEHETGHGDVDKFEIEPLFWQRLKSFAEQQDDFTRSYRERGINP